MGLLRMRCLNLKLSIDISREEFVCALRINILRRINWRALFDSVILNNQILLLKWTSWLVMAIADSERAPHHNHLRLLQDTLFWQSAFLISFLTGLMRLLCRRVPAHNSRGNALRGLRIVHSGLQAALRLADGVEGGGERGRYHSSGYLHLTTLNLSPDVALPHQIGLGWLRSYLQEAQVRAALGLGGLGFGGGGGGEGERW